MDILRDLRRRSLQLDSGDVERFRSSSASERRGSMAGDSLSGTDKKGHSSGGLLHRFSFLAFNSFTVVVVVCLFFFALGIVSFYFFLKCWLSLTTNQVACLLSGLSVCRSVFLAIYGIRLWPRRYKKEVVRKGKKKSKETGAWLNHPWRHRLLLRGPLMLKPLPMLLLLPLTRSSLQTSTADLTYKNCVV